MKKIKISDSDRRLLVLLAALLILACAYFFGFNRYSTKAEAIEEENTTKQTQLDRLKQMVGNESQVEADRKRMEAEIDEIVSKYPSKITTEKIISIIRNLEDDTGMSVSQMSFVLDNAFLDTVSQEVLDTTAEKTDDADTNTNQPLVTNTDVQGSFASVTFNYEADYDALKQMIDEINQYDDKISIINLSSAYSNEDSVLTGSVTAYLYTLDELGKKYVQPEVSRNKGVSNVFRSGTAKNVSSQEEETNTKDTTENVENQDDREQTNDVESDVTENE